MIRQTCKLLKIRRELADTLSVTRQRRITTAKVADCINMGAEYQMPDSPMETVYRRAAGEIMAHLDDDLSLDTRRREWRLGWDGYVTL